MKNNKLMGVLCIALPPLLLMLILAMFAMMSFIFTQAGSGVASDTVVVMMGVMHIILGLGGIFCVIGMFVGIPVGIYLLAQAAPITGPYDKHSGKGEASTVPAEIRGWSWGGFMLTWIWGIGNSVWLSLLCFVPFVGLVMMFVLGAKGREWAWREKKWVSVDEFKRVQKVWDTIGLVIFCLNLAWIIVMVVMFSFFGIVGTSIRTAEWSPSDTDDFGTTMMDWPDTSTDNMMFGCTTMSGMMTSSGQYSDLIRVASPIDNETLTSPVSISGVARGNWYSEAVFPVQLLDADGNELAAGQAHATGDWMTTDFVPFTAALTYTTVPTSSCGTLVLSNDNPSGDPLKSKSVEIPVNIE